MMAHVQKPPPPLGQARPDLAPLGPVLARAMAKDPAARYPDCRAFAAELRRAFAQTAAGTSTTVAPTPAPPQHFTPAPGPAPSNPGFTPVPVAQQYPPQTPAPMSGPGGTPYPGVVSQPAYASNPQQPGFGPGGPGVPPSGPWAPGGVPGPPPRRSRRGLFIALAIAAVAVIAVGGTAPLWWPSSSDEAPAKSYYQTIAMSFGSVCSVHDDDLYCWGDNSSGQLGDGTTTSRNAPTKVGALTGVTAVALGTYKTEGDDYVTTTCAAVDGSAYCWGANHYGQIGDGSTDDKTAPVKVGDLEGVTAVAVSMGSSCAIADAELYCWGNGEFGQLGTGDTSERVTRPAKIPGLHDVTQVSAANGTVCAVADKDVYCWGDNRDGQIGDGSTAVRNTPVKVNGLGEVTSLAVGASSYTDSDDKLTLNYYTCAVSDGDTYCWGSQPSGSETVQTPRQVSGLSDVKQVAVDVATFCAVDGDDKVQCWGNNKFGQVGNGSSDENTAVGSPTTVAALSDVRYVATGTSLTCARTGDDVYCWGLNSSGQLGSPQAPSDKSTAPVKVAF